MRQFMEVGEYIRNLRKSKDLLLRELAGNLSMDQAILSKIERGERKATKEQIIAISEYFNIKNDELKILWLSDKVIYELKEEEELANKVFKVSEDRIKYGKS
jgi:HTH-type transcriptional regulator, competence development regulator